ncbi:hypothetical protein L596_003143 [Steinernema carpocapsae]|nr:hypothetical protein L596_003143 [Steinernema carpocapsae]
MALALVLEIFILGWTILSCFAFCCPSIFVPLPILCGFVTVFLIVAISIYGAKNHDKIGKLQFQLQSTALLTGHLPRNNNQLNGMDNVGYSFWIGTFSLIMMGIATLVGCAVSVTSKVLP